MRIYVVHNTYRQAGGEDAVVAAEVELLRSAGHEVTLGLVSNDEIEGAAGKVAAFMDAAHNPRRAEWLGGELQRTQAELLHVHNFFPLLTPAVHQEAARRGVAVVQTLHNYRLLCGAATFLRNGRVCEKCTGNRRYWGVVHRCYRGSLPGSLAVYRMQEDSRRREVWNRDVHRFIALSEFQRSKYVAAGFPADRITVKPNFVPAFDGELPSERRGALFVGRLSPEKGVDFLLEAWRRLPHIPLTIVGGGPERGRLEAIAPRNVTFTGAVSPASVRTWMLQSAALIVPSQWYEPFGLVVAEAFALGLPVIASRIGALPELVKSGATGVLFEPGNKQDLVDAVSSSLSGPPRFDAGVIRREHSERFSPQVNLARLEGVYVDAVTLASTGSRTRAGGTA